MRPYGKKHSKAAYCTGPCCGPDKKEGIKRRERQHAKREIVKQLKDTQ